MSNDVPFRASREDGRSDVQVVIDLVEHAEPGAIFSYEDLMAALCDELEGDVVMTRQRAGNAARRANLRLLREHRRELSVVPGVGYRMVKATEQRSLAIVRETRAERQLGRALKSLNFARLDEMDEANRIAHLAHLQISSAIWAVTQRIAKQQSRQDDAIKRLTQRLNEMEATG